MNTRPITQPHERGLTLVEILVAVAILAVAAVIALSLYDVSRKSFKKGENVTEQQQAVRIAFDRMAADLRMTGFNYNPDGDPNRPDEQIEAALDRAVVIRADLDAEDPTDSLNPETALAGGGLISVSTGNDEIIAYVLAKPDGSSTDTLTFFADVAEQPRDAAVEAVNIPNVDLSHTSPPYTLYRITLNNDTTSYGGGSFLVRTPLIENVYSMEFAYIDGSDNPVAAPGGAEDDVSVATRKSIRRIGLNLVGLTRDPDPDFEDANDTVAATRQYRKFELSGEVKPRNIGMIGVKDISADVTPPSRPASPSLVPGHCGGLYVSWTANPSDDQVAYYTINYGTTSGSYTVNRNTSDTSYYLGGLNDATTYYVALSAVDASGNVSLPSSESNAGTTNVNTPQAPLNLAATTGLTGAVELTWDSVSDNTASQPAGDPAAPRIRDLAGYRVYRGETASFAQATLIADENQVRDSASPSYPDQQVVACRTYEYWISAVDRCGVESNESVRASGNSYSNVAPEAPTEVQALFVGASDVGLSWDAVEANVDGDRIFIDTYRVYRAGPFPEGMIPDSDGLFLLHDTVQGDTTYTDDVSGELTMPGLVLYYKVSAIDDCGNESALSETMWADCAFSGDVVIVSPTDNQPVAGVVPVTVAVANGSDTYTGVALEFIHEIDGPQLEIKIDQVGTSWTYNWLANPPGPYTIRATVYNDVDCTKSETIHVYAGFDVGCCLSPPDPDLRPIVLTCDGSGNSQCAPVSYELINNNCLTSVAIDSITINWTDVTGNDPYLEVVYFDGTSIWNPGNTSPLPSPASNAFSDPPPTLPVGRDSTFPVLVTYEYTDNMAERLGQDRFRNTLTTSYDFTLLDGNGDRTAITGTCGPSTGMFDDMIVESP